jgi:hypothetical protein
MKKRIFSKSNIENFTNTLINYDWNCVTNIPDFTEAFSLFHTEYKGLYDKCFPLKVVRNGYKNRKCWLSEGLRNSIKIKNRLYVLSKQFPTAENLQKYKMYKSKLQKLMRSAERQHFQNLLESNKGNLKKSWDIIKEIINKKQSSVKSCKFVINGENTTNCKDIANAFNHFYTGIGKSLSEKIPSTNTDPITNMASICVQNSLYLTPTDENEVLRIISNIKTTSVGWDDIHSKVVKSSFYSYSKVLVHLINMSLEQGIFPDEMKCARVIPLYKSGDSKLINNYRPVSILPILSKVFERVIYNRLHKFIDDNNLIYNLQFGFRAKYNTTMALLTLIDKIVAGIDKNEMTLGTFLDFSKAFDTVNHKILIRKLHKYGIRGIANNLINSYLSNRKQFVSFNNVLSEAQVITYGVPQGSILGPLLFVLYINDIYLVSNSIMPILFADDSSLFVQGKDINTMTNVLNHELDHIYNWVNTNKLSLNVEKTYRILFKAKRRHAPGDFQVKIANKV